MMKSSVWVTNFQQNSDAPFRLFAFPFAGGGAAIYRQWAQQLPGVEVLGVRLPGRETRIRDTAISSMEELIEALSDAIVPLLDRPYAFFGHSLGSLVSFELARRITELAGREPSCLLVSAFRSPDRATVWSALHRLPDSEFVRKLSAYGGLPDQVLKSPEILELVLPTLRADFAVFETYKYEARSTLNCPIVGFWGTRDQFVSESEVHGWSSQTNSGFKLYGIDGEHFFVTSHESCLVQHVASALKPFIMNGMAESRSVLPHKT